MFLWKYKGYPGVNFINILNAAFARTDSESAKKTEDFTVFFVLFGSAWVKAACKMLMKSTLQFLFNLKNDKIIFESPLWPFLKKTDFFVWNTFMNKKSNSANYIKTVVN